MNFKHDDQYCKKFWHSETNLSVPHNWCPIKLFSNLNLVTFLYNNLTKPSFPCLHRKNDFVEISKNLGRYRSENNMFGRQNWSMIDMIGFYI